MDDCLFCKVVKGEERSWKVYEDEYTYAFLDLTPVTSGHVLVVPKEHSVNIFDISSEALCATVEAVRVLAPAVKKAMNADGVNVHMNNERSAGQVIPHTHLHVIPRFDDDGRRLWKGVPQSEDELDKAAQHIIGAL